MSNTTPPGGQETTIEKTVVVQGPATGGLLVLCIALILVGIAATALGIFLPLPAAARVALIIPGLGLVAAFGFVAVGARRIGSQQKGVPGAEIPQGSTVTTKIVQTGFPKQGRSPLEPVEQTGKNPEPEVRTSKTPTGDQAGTSRADRSSGGP